MSDTCKKCGENLYGNKVNCPFCGEPIKNTSYSSTGRTTMNSNNVYNSSSNNTYSNNGRSPQNRTGGYARSTDTGGGGWGLLGFCIPIAGIVLYFVWKNEKPNTASACLTGALISLSNLAL